MNHKLDNINKFLNVFRSPLKILGLVSIVLLLAGIVTAWTYTTPPHASCEANGTCYFGNTKWNETTFLAESLYATSNVTAGYHNTTDGRELQNGGCDASYCIRYNLTDGTTIEAINKTDGSAIRGADFVTVLNSVNTNTPASVMLSGENFSISNLFDLPDGIIFSGQGNKTVLTLSADTNVIHATTNNSIIKDMRITCGGRARKGVYLYNGRNNVVDNVEVDSCNLVYSAINLWNETDSEVRNSVVRDSEEAINIAGNHSGAVNNKVYGNATDTNPDNGITLGVTNLASSKLYAYDNYIEGNYDGIYLWNVDQASVSRNILNHTLKGIILCCNTTNSTIGRNNVLNITSTLNFGGIHVEATNDGNTIADNTVIEAYQGGIHVLANRTVVKNNILKYNGANGVLIQDSSNNTVEGNECYNNNYRNSATPSGIRTVNATNNSIKNNHCWDDRTTKLQKYGITLTGILDLNNRVEGNDVQWGGVTGNINVPSTSLQIQNYGAAGYNHGNRADCTTITAFGEGDACYNTTRHLGMHWNGTYWVLYNETRP